MSEAKDTRSFSFTPRHFFGSSVGTLLDANAYRGDASHVWENGFIRNSGEGTLYLSFLGKGQTAAPTSDAAKETLLAGDETFFAYKNLDNLFVRSVDAGVSDAAVANQTARLALTGITQNQYVVFQTDTGFYYSFTGTDASNNAHWTNLGTTLVSVEFELHGTPV